MKKRTISKTMHNMAVFTVVAAIIFAAGACGSSPREAGASELLVIPQTFVTFADNTGYVNSNFEPKAGTVTLEDGTEAFYIEHAKTRMQTNGTYEVRFWLANRDAINFRSGGYTRMSVDIATNNPELLDDIVGFYPRLRKIAGEWVQWNRTSDFLSVATELDSDPTEFVTMEWSIVGELHSGNTTFASMTDVSNIWLRFIPATNADIPGRLYFRNLRLFRD